MLRPHLVSYAITRALLRRSLREVEVQVVEVWFSNTILYWLKPILSIFNRMVNECIDALRYKYNVNSYRGSKGRCYMAN